MKKIFCLIVLTLSIFCFISCTNSSITLKINQNILEWNEYQSAKAYIIYIDDAYYEQVKSTSYELILDNGRYEIKVRAVLDGAYSDFSNTIVYEVTNANRLDTPKITISGNRLSWSDIEGASTYEIYINNSLYAEVTNYSYQLDLTEGDYDIYVIACGKNGLYSDKSNIVTYNKSYNHRGVVNIFAINDTHGAIITDDDIPGMEKVATVIDNLESSSEYIKVANGDIFQGSYASNITHGKVFIDTLNAMDFDCFVIGNHEFDWGLEEISKYKDGDLSNGEAEFPFLSANIVYKENYSSPSWLEPYTIVENNNYRVGIIGIIGEYLTSSISSNRVEDYVFLNPIPIVEQLASELRTVEDCDFVIVANHEYSSSTNEQLAELNGDARIDAILCAHTHQKINEYVRRSDSYLIPILQSNTKNYTVGSISLEVAESEIINCQIKHYYPINYTSSQKILDIINQYQAVFDEGNKIIGYSTMGMDKSDLGVFAANAMRSYTGSDIAFINTGGVRAEIKQGEILIKQVYEVFPFDNKIVNVTMTKDELIRFCDYSYGYMYYSDNLDLNNLTASYYVVSIVDYVYTSPTYLKFFKGLDAVTLDDYIRDVVIWAFQEE